MNTYNSIPNLTFNNNSQEEKNNFKKLKYMDEYNIPLGDTRYVFRNLFYD